MTYTIELTGIDEDLLARLKHRATQDNLDLPSYARKLMINALEEIETIQFINEEIHAMRRERRQLRAVAEAMPQKVA